MHPGTVVVIAAHERARSPQRRTDCVVTTPLDMIAKLERGGISRVVLTESADARGELASFLLETYPAIRVEVGHVEPR